MPCKVYRSSSRRTLQRLRVQSNIIYRTVVMKPVLSDVDVCLFPMVFWNVCSFFPMLSRSTAGHVHDSCSCLLAFSTARIVMCRKTKAQGGECHSFLFRALRQLAYRTLLTPWVRPALGHEFFQRPSNQKSTLRRTRNLHGRLGCRRNGTLRAKVHHGHRGQLRKAFPSLWRIRGSSAR